MGAPISLAVGIACLGALLCTAPARAQVEAPGGPAPPALPQPPDARPNVVVVMTDDQTVGSMHAMARTRALIGAAGTTFTRSFVNNPRCCPSRSTFLTGQLSHNHGVITNGPPRGGWPALRTSNWLPTWLQAAGYRTAHVGKFLNHYGRTRPEEVPAGWDEWHGTVDPTTYRYFNYRVNENGELRTYGEDRDPDDYQTDFTTRRATELIDELGSDAEPFFLSVAYLAPHTGSPREPGDPFVGTPAVAPRHKGLFDFAPLPRPPSFNERDLSDKPFALRRFRLSRGIVGEITSLYRQRQESLLSVDEGVERIVGALERADELANTLIVFTSDNGYLSGEHRLPHGKAKVYEPGIRVPLLVRGPGFPVGARRRQLVSNADLAPTILDVSGARPGRRQDGRSLVPLANDPRAGSGRSVLIEIAQGRRMRTTAIRTSRYLYAEHRIGARELYDLLLDPYELASVHRDRSYRPVRRRLALRLDALRDCRGPRRCDGTSARRARRARPRR